MTVVNRQTLTVFTGPMKSAKTMQLIHAHILRQHAKRKVAAFRPKRDTRESGSLIKTRFGDVAIPAIMISEPHEILAQVSPDTAYVSIDEAQFFTSELTAVIEQLLKTATVAVAGLDLDYRAKPFGVMSELLALADTVHKYTAICDVCGEPARFTQRLTNGRPSRLSEPIIMIDGNEATYEARCHRCYRAPR